MPKLRLPPGIDVDLHNAMVEYNAKYDKWLKTKEGSEERKTAEKELRKAVKEVRSLEERTRVQTARSAQIEATGETKSAIFPGMTTGTKGGLKTRRRKHRNGPSRVQRHRASRVSARKRPTRRS